MRLRFRLFLVVLMLLAMAGLDGLVWAQSATSQAVDSGDSVSIQNASQAYMKGNYSTATEMFRSLLETGPADLRVEAAIGLAESLAIVGEYEKSLDVLDSVAETSQQNSKWHVAVGLAQANLGLYDDALAHATAALKLNDKSAPAILLQGQMLETIGRRDDAIKAYKQMELIIEDESFRKDAEALVALGKIMDRYAVLTGRRASDQARNILHNYFQDAYQKVQPGYWQANIAAGIFLLEKHKAAEAAEEFDLANKLNPKIPPAHAGMAVVFLEQWQFEKCLAAANRALKINPDFDQALLAKAACYMQWRKLNNALPLLEKILKTNPNHIEALSMLAAVYVRKDQPDKAKPFENRVRSINPKCVELPETIAAWLIAGRQFDQAEIYLKQAAELSPTSAGPWAALGSLYMQTGEEDKALEVLEKAHKLDDFRADVVNYLNIAKKLESFEVKESEHFIVKVDGRYDRVLLEQISSYMEEIYPEVTSDYSYEPKRKTIVEVLPHQQEFSARISGRGWVPTVGACTGRVIAITAPNKARGVLGLHNWAQVLRHEFAHSVTLEATDNKIPHWLTEACAVWQQKDKRAFQYIQTLVNATQKKELFPIARLDWGFIRPKKQGDRILAYAQSEWILEFIIQSRGFEKLSEMLQGFKKGQSQKEVFENVFGISERQFDKEFQAWARETVTKWGFEPRAEGKLIQAARGVGIFANSKKSLIAKAQKLLTARKFAQARKQADLVLEKEPDNWKAMHIVARSYLGQKDWPGAIESLELLQRRRPMDSFSYEELAKIYAQLGQPEKALPNLIYLHKHTMNTPQYARQIAEIYRTLGQPDAALDYFREVTFINPYETSAHEAMATLFLKQRNFDLALSQAGNLTLLEPQAAHSWNYLAMVRYRVGLARKNPAMLKQAREAALKGKQLDPKSQADQILQYIDAALEKLDNTGS